MISSCSLQHRLDKYCPICPQKTIIKDSIRIEHDSITRIDTIWKIKPADSMAIVALVNCNNGIAHMDTIIIREKQMSIIASVDNGRLNVKAKCPADSIMNILVDTRKEFKEFRDKQTTKTIIVTEKKYPAKFFYWWFAATVLGLGFFVYRKFK